MDALALYLWHLLRSRDESDSDEEEVELPHVKLPEITVLRRKENLDGRNRKRVSGAEQVHKSSVIKNNDPVAGSSKSPHYTLVPVCTDHDYTPSLVCSRQLPGGRQVRKGVEVKGIGRKERDSENEDPNSKTITTIQKQIMHKNPVDPPGKSAVQKDAIIEPNKVYRPVHCWNELLEQFDTKPEDGDKLFAKLIAALSDKEEGSGVEPEINSDDPARVETLKNDDELTLENDDDDSDLVEIVVESSTPSAEETSIVQAKQSNTEASGNVCSELFDKCIENKEPINGTSCDLNKEDASAAQLEYFFVIKESKEDPVDCEQNLDSSTNVDLANSNCSLMELQNGDLDKYIIAVVDTTASCVDTVVEQSDILDVPAECIKQEILTEEAIAVSNLLSSSVIQSEIEIQESEEFKDPSDQAVTTGETHRGPQRKRSRKNIEISESDRTDDRPPVKKKRPYKYRPSPLTPIEKLSKRALVTRLAREIRSSQDPLDLMDCEEFKNTFGFSKQFAEFLTTSLTPHLHKALRIDGTSNHLKVLAALYFFTTGCASAEVGRVAHLSQPQVSRNVTDVICALNLSAPEPELPTSDSVFDELYGLPNIIGAVDATHIPIKPPSGIGRKCPDKERFENPKPYRNSANYFSINVEIVSSISNRIMFCCSKLPGTSTKSLMWQQSKVRDLVIARQVDENSPDRLIGSGYSCEPWMLTPCSTTSHVSAQRYNNALASALQDSIRLTIGLLKGRFKCLSLASKQQCLYYTPAKACHVITACCVLHNMAMDFGEEIPDPVFDEFDTVETDVDEREINWDGLEARSNYIVEHFS